METDRIVALNPPNISIASFIGSGINGNTEKKSLFHVPKTSSNIASFIGSGINGNPPLNDGDKNPLLHGNLSLLL